jgi:hypothetical protein
MVQKSSTHRLTDAARSSPASGGERESQPVRENNPALVSTSPSAGGIAPVSEKRPEKKLLHFGLDYAVLNIGFVEKKQSPALRFCDAIFSFPHNDTNASEITDFVWGDSSESVSIHFSHSSDGDQIAFVFRDKDKISVIQKVTSESQLRTRLGYKYDYRISFYGAFWSLVRLRKVSVEDYLGLFLRDVESDNIRHSISRLDLCSDIANVSPNEIIAGIRGNSKHKKKLTIYGQSHDESDAETIDYGRKRTAWFARVYNKLIEAARKGKQRYFPDYFEHEKQVTRLEVQLNSAPLQQYKVELKDLFNIERLFSLYAAHLRTKYVTWDIFKFIHREVKKNGFQAIQLQRHKLTYKVLSKDRYFLRTESMVRRCAERWGKSVDWVCLRISNKSNDVDD